MDNKTTWQELQQTLRKADALISKLLGESEKDLIPDEKSSYANESLEMTVTRYLHEMGIPTNIKGYFYLRTAIMLAIGDEKIMEGITKLLYPTIAKKHNTTPARVERGIRHAIEVGYLRGKENLYEEIFGYSISMKSDRPVNSHFISAVADYIRLRI